jgi:hypothetical protein
MEVRFTDEDIYYVVSTNPGSATLVSQDRRRMTITLFPDLEYRKARNVPRGVDREAPGVVRSQRSGNETNEEDDMAAKARLAGAPVPKGKATKGSKKARKAKGNGAAKDLACLCGCGGKTARYFVPGHDARFKGWLAKMLDGKSAKEVGMPAAVEKALGPWAETGKGVKPSKGYKDLRG